MPSFTGSVLAFVRSEGKIVVMSLVRGSIEIQSGKILNRWIILLVQQSLVVAAYSRIFVRPLMRKPLVRRPLTRC